MLRRIIAMLALAILVSQAFASAPTTTPPTLIAVAGDQRLAMDSIGRVFTKDADGFGWTQIAQAPPGVPVSWQQSVNAGYYWLGMANGDVFIAIYNSGPSITWNFNGNVFSAQNVATQAKTWSRTKAGYR